MANPAQMNAEVLNLFSWAQAHGASLGDIRVDGRKVYTRQLLAEGSTVFSVPTDILMNVEAATKDATFGEAYKKLAAAGASDKLLSRLALANKKIRKSPRKLTIFVAVERAKKEISFWAPYLASLPTSHSTPMWFSESELDQLRGTKVAASLARDQAGLEDIFTFWSPQFLSLWTESHSKGGCQLMSEVLHAALQRASLLWAHTTVQSRAFTLLFDKRLRVTMVPLFDMLNHSPNARVAWITNETESRVDFISTASIPGDSEVHNNYGQKANDELLQGYGFCLYPNPADVFYVRIGLSTLQVGENHNESVEHFNNRSEVKSRQELLWRMNVPAEFSLSLLLPVPKLLIATSKLCLLPNSMIYKCAGIGWGASLDLSMPKSTTTDLKVVCSLYQLLATSLERLWGGPEVGEDKRLLDQYRDFDNSCALHARPDNLVCDCTKFALMYRLGQKEILHTALNALKDCAAPIMEIQLMRRMDAAHGDSKSLKVSAETRFITNYTKWLSDNGIALPYISEIMCNDYGRSTLVLTRDCVAGDILASVPQHLLLSADLLKMTLHPLNEVLTQDTEANELLMLTLLLLYELGRGIKSIWAPFITELEYLVNSLIFYTDEFEELDGTGLGDVVTERIQHLHQQHETIVQPLQKDFPHLFSKEVCTFKHWLWADTVVEECSLSIEKEIQPIQHSNCQHSVGRGLHKVLVLAPVFSNLPSIFQGSVTKCSRDLLTGNLVLHSLCSMKAGTKFQVPLIEFDNETRLLQFGAFTAAMNNELDVVEISISPSPDSTFSDLQEKLLLALGLGTVHYLDKIPNPALSIASMAVCSMDSEKIFEECGAFQFLKCVDEAKLAATQSEKGWSTPQEESLRNNKSVMELTMQAKEAYDVASLAAADFMQKLLLPRRTRSASFFLRKVLSGMQKGMAGGSAEDDKKLWLEASNMVCDVADEESRVAQQKAFCSMLAYRHGQKEILESWQAVLKFKAGAKQVAQRKTRNKKKLKR